MKGPSLGVLLITAILSISVWLNLSLLFQTDAAVGIDGYYYVLQIDSLSDKGHLYFPTKTPLVLYFLSALSLVTGNTVIAVKLGSIILQALLSLGVGVLLQSLTKNIWLAALGVFFIEFSVLHLYFLSEFLSNLGALACLIWGTFGLIKAFQTKKKIWLASVGLMLLAASFSHRSAVWIIVCFFFLVLLAYFWLNYATNFKRQSVFGLILFILFILPFLLAWQPFVTLPEWLSSELSKAPKNPFRLLTLLESLTLLIVSVSTFAILFLKPKLLREDLAGMILLSIVIGSSLSKLNPFLDHHAGITGIISRLDLLAYVQASLAFPILLSVVLPFSKTYALALVMVLFPILSLRVFVPLPMGLRAEYLHTREQLIREVPLMRPRICENGLVVARHGDQFLLTAIVGIPSQDKSPAHNNYECIFWLVHQPRVDYQFIFENAIESSAGDFILVEQTELVRQFGSITAEEKYLLVSENLHLRNLPGG